MWLCKCYSLYKLIYRNVQSQVDVFPQKFHSSKAFFNLLLPALLLGFFFSSPDWLNLCSLACLTLLCFLCCSLALSSTSIPASYCGSGHGRLSCTGRLTASASRSPGVLLWQELLVTDISPHLKSEWAKNNVALWLFYFFLFLQLPARYLKGNVMY